jgi:hypothetical protein
MCRAAFSFAEQDDAMIPKAMFRMRRKFPISAMLLPLSGVALSLSACGNAETDPGPGGVNTGDAKALDSAAEKLDERQNNPGATAPKN